MTKKLILAAFVAAFAFTSCHKDPTPTPDPTPEPQTVTRLSSEEHITATGMMTMNLFALYTWENGLLMRECDSLITPFISTVFHEKMSYENGNLVKIEEESGKWTYSFTYEDGLLKTYLNVTEGDSSAWGKVTAYTEDGLVKEIMDYNIFTTTRWTLTWVDGDATEVKEEVLAPEDMIATYVYNFTYDDKPSAYTGTPLANVIPDGDGAKIAKRLSKHNQIEEGYTYDYNEKGYLISAVIENDTAFYHYIEQTIE